LTGGAHWPEEAKPPPVQAAPGLDDARALVPADTQNLRIAQVSVRRAPEFNRTAPHNGVTNDDIIQTLSAQVLKGLSGANPTGQIPVRAEVEILRFHFANVAVGVVTGFKGSFAEFRTTLFYLDSGAQVGRAATSRAATGARPTLLGVLAIRMPEEELLMVAGAAPQSIATRLFGR